MDKNDIARSSRSIDFNVQISAVNIHSHCSQMFGKNYNFNLSLCYFSGLLLLKTTYGNSNVSVFFVIKPTIELISFQLK